MSGVLEIPAFVIGLAGVTGAYDKVCLIWKTLAQAANYGDDVAQILTQVEMEYFRFEMWWSAMADLVKETKGSQQKARTAAPKGSLFALMQESMSSQFLGAVTQIQTGFEKIEQILKKNGSLATLNELAKNPPPPTSTGALSTPVERIRESRRRRARRLLKNTSFTRRVIHSAKPWGDADKNELEKEAQKLRSGNDQLYSILPQRLRDVILEQGISGYLLHDAPAATAVSSLGSTSAVTKTANLVLLRGQTSQAAGHDRPAINVMAEEIREASNVRRISASTPPLSGPVDTVWSSSHYTPPPTPLRPSATSRVLIEWYNYPASAYLKAMERLARLSHLLRAEHKPTTLSTLPSRGVVHSSNIDAIGLIFSIPPTADPTKLPVSLHQLLEHKPPRPLPTLHQRLHLASALSSTLYTFLLARWHHKRFISDSIVFLYELSRAGSLPDLARPYVAGFGLSRPEDPQATSFPLTRADKFEIYLHPALAAAKAAGVTPLPKARAAFDVYSFGLVLVEIGFWIPLRKVVGDGGRNGDAETVRARVVDKCERDLACWAGERYRYVTLRCLRAEDMDAGGVGEELSDFFDVVVAELARCSEGSEV
ncbi:hypothetical protein C8A05DRAFT_36673 [Staphylotrichum tortipilum]|uniref:Prion-inhibition and propagation HeLo domain-containing protein n=1 Tax=Staphylotrichum tortipilum TaxID=2831512 RepID=A0AAN6MGD7_9PEZI|nr:hypothetical protein C8A05DRAFT_36673 [Staphylotrichum longicolle]